MMSSDAATDARRPLFDVRGESLFLVWGPPSLGPRSRVFARELGIDVVFISSTQRRGILWAPLKYASQSVKTLRMLFRRRPRLVFVQSPPTFAVLSVRLYCSRSPARFIVDAHSAAMLSPYWTKPRWLYRRLARRAFATIVTNEHFANIIRAQGGRALVIRDIPTRFESDESFAVADSFNVMVVNTFAPDEPLDQVIAAARDLDDVTFYVTGDPGRIGRALPEDLPGNVRFTGFLPDRAYYGLMRSSHAVLCLTTRDHTMQRGACEALSMGRPIITSDWPLLRQYFDNGAVHIAPHAAGIRAGVEEMARNYARYATEIERLRVKRGREWESALESLLAIVSSRPDRYEASDERRGVERHG